MPTDSGAEQEAEQPTELTAGEVLQAERLRRDLSEKEVADRLHITMHYVRSIETNCYEKLPGAVFAKGYIKSYALLLDLVVEDVLKLYENFTVQQQQVVSAEANRQNTRRKKDRNRIWVIASIVVFTAGFAGLWAFDLFFGDADSNNTGSESVTVSDTLVGSTTIETSALAKNSGPAGQEISKPEPSVATGRISLDAYSAEGLAAMGGNPVVNKPSTGSQVQPIAAVDVAISEGALNSGGGRVIEVATSGDDVLRITFSGVSWIEVNDGESNQIYRDIRVEGDVLEITGNAPFTLLLGDAPFASLSFNGSEIDISEQIRVDHSARLTVGL